MIEKNELREYIERLIDYSARRTIKDTGGLKSLDIENDIVNVVLILEKKDNTLNENTKKDLVRLVKLTLGFPGIKYKFEYKENKLNKPRFIGIASGKGGVGKSNIAINLAFAFKSIGKKVGLIDADIYGASIPNILKLENVEVLANEEEKIYPIKYQGIELISTAFFVEGDKPVVWRGPMLQKMLSHFFNDVLWDKDLDVVFIDLPPGTGDVSIDVAKFSPEMEVIVITTPQVDAAKIAMKAGFMAKDLNHKILGVIENMSYFINPVNGNKEYIFGEGGGLDTAQKLQTKLIKQIPIRLPQKTFDFDKNENQEIFKEIANALIKGE